MKNRAKDDLRQGRRAAKTNSPATHSQADSSEPVRKYRKVVLNLAITKDQNPERPSLRT